MASSRVVAVVAALSACLGLVLVTPGRSGADAQCSPDPASTIGSMPPGSTWNGGGLCYFVPNGIQITKPTTVTDATFVDPSAARPSVGRFRSVIQVRRTSNVTLSNLTVVGGESGHRFQGDLVGQAGIRVLNSSSVTISHVSISHVFGDGLEFWGDFPRYPTPNRYIRVEWVTIGSVGRNGISPSNIADSTFRHVTIGPTGQASIDFESDLKGIGAGHLLFSDCHWSGFIVGETLTGPITLADSSLTNQILARFKQPQPYAITFLRDTIALTPKAIPGILMNRASLVFRNTQFSRPIGDRPARGPMWRATDGSRLILWNSPVVLPMGITDSTSQVIFGGPWFNKALARSLPSPPVQTPEAPSPLLLIPIVAGGLIAYGLLQGRRRDGTPR